MMGWKVGGFGTCQHHYRKVKIDGDSRYQKVGDRKGSKKKPRCRDG